MNYSTKRNHKLNRALRPAWLALAAGLTVARWSSTSSASPVPAAAAEDFLNSIGTQCAISARGENFQKTLECVQFLGVRWLRAGVEGNVPVEQFIELHQKTGVRFSWGLGSGSTSLTRLLETARQLEPSGALLAFEGNNEPNNWGITYEGQKGGRNLSWVPVAKLQRDLYHSVKSDPILRKYPVWSISEGGAETDNVGLQFLTIPPGAGTVMPAGTKYADDANVHNYIYHPNASGLADNKTWDAADPSRACKVDGLYGEYGVTWAHHFAGYSGEALEHLPRVTTETGTTIGGVVTEEIHALNLLSLYLDQFKRGWNHTAVYLMRDRVDEGGNQKFGFFAPDYSPRKAAVFLHNLTTILGEKNPARKAGTLDYTIPGEPATVHDLLLRKSDSSFALVVWGELVNGSTNISVSFATAPASVRIYDPTEGTEPIRTVTKTRTIPLEMSNHPFVLGLPR